MSDEKMGYTYATAGTGNQLAAFTLPDEGNFYLISGYGMSQGQPGNLISFQLYGCMGGAVLDQYQNNSANDQNYVCSGIARAGSTITLNGWVNKSGNIYWGYSWVQLNKKYNPDKASDSPIGEIISYMGTKAPANYLICDGTEYKISLYPYLAQHFIDNFGSANFFGGDGTTTFALPDLRGEFLRGAGTGERNTGSGANVGAHQSATYHTLVAYNPDGNINFGAGGMNVDNYDLAVDQSSSSRYATTSSYSSKYNRRYTSRPTNTSVLYCIKYTPSNALPIQDQVIYSYEERCVGTWVNEKPLYEKTIDFGSLPNAALKEVSHGIENVEDIWVYDGYIRGENLSNSSVPLVYSPGAAGYWYSFATDKNIGIQTSSNRTNLYGVVTIRYTKTTDQSENNL